MNKKIAILVFGLLLAGALSLAADIVEEIVAVVNDDIITLSQFKKYNESIHNMLRQQFQGEELDKQFEKAKTEMMNSMVTDLLLLQAAKQKQFTVAEQVKSALSNIKKENNFDTDEQLREALTRQGMDYNEFVKQIEENMMRQAVILSEVDRAIVVDESEVVAYFKLHPEQFVDPEEYKLRGIYLESGGRSKEDLEAKKQAISSRLKTGGDFAALSVELSDSPLKETKGDLGTIQKGQIDKTLGLAVEKLKTGEISPWIQAKTGWYILKLEEKKDSRQKPFEEVKKDVEQKLFQDKRTKKLDEYLKQIREKSYIKIIKASPLES
jgi:parvulin-like peptidyl-prolyl isomerase